MRILVVTNMYPTEEDPSYGIFVRDHVESLRAHRITVDVFFTNGRESRSAYISRLAALAKTLRGEEYALIHAQHSYCMFQLAAVRPVVGAMPPVVFTIHEGEALSTHRSTLWQDSFLKVFAYSKRIKKYALRMADKVVSVEERLPRAVGFTGAFSVIPPGVDTSLFRPMDRMQCRSSLGLPAAEKIAFFPADPSRLGKGFALLQKALDCSGINIRVVAAGRLQHEAMPKYMNAADIVVQTSAFEASPMVVKEAMACNRPIVCTDVGDVRALFGRTGGCFIALVDPRDIGEKISMALGSIGAQGRSRLLELGLDLGHTTRKYLDVYKAIAA